MKNGKIIIKILVLAILLVVLINPQLNPLLNEGAKNAATAELHTHFGVIAGGSSGLFTPAKIISCLAVAVFVWLITTVVCFVLDKTSRGKHRSETVAGLLSSVIKTVGAIAGIVWVLSVMGVNLGAIFASLGVVSLIVGFGVQSLIEDCVTGIFIILEGVYNIGDIIVLDDFRGTVKKITMRTTTIQDAGGNLKIINNSDIRNVQNRSNSLSYAVCRVGISYDSDLLKVEEILARELPAIYERNSDIFKEVPTYGGVDELADSSVVIRVLALVSETDIFVAQRRLNREMKLLLDKHNIEIPFPQVVVHKA